MQVVLDGLDGVLGQRQQTLFVAFAVDPDLFLGQAKIVQSDRRDFVGAKAIEEPIRLRSR